MDRALLAPRYWPSWMAVGLFWCIHWMPVALRHALGRGVGRLAWRFNHKRRGIVLKNLELCFPDWSQAQRETIGIKHFLAMGVSLIDSSLLWFASDRRVNAIIQIEGWEHYEQARAEGFNIIFHVAHSTGLEFGAMAISHQEAGIGFYKSMKNPVVDHFVLRSRLRFGNQLFRRDEGARQYIKAVKAGKLLYFLSDEDYGPEQSVFAPFFVATKASLPAAGKLARLAKAAVLPAISYYDPEQCCYVTKVYPALQPFPLTDEQQDVNVLNHALEVMIAPVPEHYMWTLKLFRTQPNQENIYA